MSCLKWRRDRTKEYPFHIDARNSSQRDFAGFLREEHLSGVDADDEASVVLEIEHARIALFASAGTIAFEVSQMLAVDRPICAFPLYLSLVFLMAAMVAAWIGLARSEGLRRFRVDRRYKIYNTHTATYFRAKDEKEIDHKLANEVWAEQLGKEDTKRIILRVLRYIVIALVAIGISLGIASAVGTVDSNHCLLKSNSRQSSTWWQIPA